MTREEAREILTHNWTRVDNPNYSESELDEAFFMAIEALSADAVSRKDGDMLLVDLNAENGYLLDGKYKINGREDLCEDLTDGRVEVVRCKDCRHWDTADGECYGHDHYHCSEVNDYCSHGERREL